jgi:aspartate/methionine/tyrosine aminotransferase
MMIDGLSEIPGLRIPEPEGAFYVFADVTGTGMSDIEFADGALKAGVQLIPASLISGGKGFVRISYAASEDMIIEGIARLKKWLL